MFAKEVEELWDYFGNVALRISHIGSTAIDGLEAKPIIDIAVAVRDLSDFDKVAHKFSSDPDYSIKKDSDPGEILIRKGPEGNRSFYIHVMDLDSKRYKDSILFRDTLVKDELICNDYRALKHHLAEKYPHNRKKYTSGKADFIETTLALVWARTALVPLAVITCILAVTFGVGLWMMLNLPTSFTISGVPAHNIARVALAIGGILGAICLGAVIILFIRFIKAHKKYLDITSKIPKSAKKD